MPAHSGKFGAINNIGSVRTWTINESMTPAVAVVSNSRFGRIRRGGVKSWNGNYTQLLAQPSILPGTVAAFSGYTAPVNQTWGGNGIIYYGDILVSQAQINWNWENGEMINSSISFEGHLALDNKADDWHYDSTIPAPETLCGTKVEYSVNGSDYTEIENLSQAQLILTCDVQNYVNSSTDCWTGRRAGPYDWTVALTQQETVRATGIDIGDEIYLRMYTNDTEYWLLQWGLVRDFSNIQVNIETGAIISRTINIDMNATDGSSIGTVLAPDGITQWWGQAVGTGS